MSVLSGRGVAEIARGAPARRRAREAPAAPPPRFVAPPLATLAGEPPAGQEWLFELKHDGYRAQLRVADGKATVLTRGGHDWTERSPTVAAAAARLPVRAALLDGEIVALEPSGAGSFARLKATLAGEARDALVCYAFDLLFHDGVDLRGLPLAERKRQLETILDPRDAGAAIRLSEHVAGDGGLIRRERAGWVPKASWPSARTRLTAPAAATLGSRSSAAPGRGWRSAASPRARGTTAAASASCSWAGRRRVGSPTPAGSAPAGTRPPPRRCSAGWSRSGPPRRPSRRCPPPARREARWVEPKLVAEVAFQGWIGDGMLRHASFVGLRAGGGGGPPEAEPEAAPPGDGRGPRPPPTARWCSRACGSATRSGRCSTTRRSPRATSRATSRRRRS